MESFNAGYENHSVDYLANLVKECIGENVKILKDTQMMIGLIMSHQKK